MSRDILIAALSAIAGTSLIHDEPVSTTHQIKPKAGTSLIHDEPVSTTHQIKPKAGTFTPKVQQKFTRWKGARKG